MNAECEPRGRLRDFVPVRKTLAAASMFLVVAGCGPQHENTKPSHDERQAPAFVHPGSAEYFLNQNDLFYQKVGQLSRRVHDPSVKRRLDELLATPVAQWLNGDFEDTRKTIAGNLERSVPAGEVPVFVAYNIPDRDLGGEAGGGLDSPSRYMQWIRLVSETIGDAPAVVVLEPDALADIPNLPDGEARDERIRLLRDALTVLREQNEHTAVYLDSGNSKWLKEQQLAELIRRVDPDRRLVGAIALNVANRRSEQETRNYAQSVSHLLGYQLHVLIDNSRNGAPNTDDLQGWCNVKGEQVGKADATYSPDLLVEEAFIKTPGESDGRCGESQEKSGTFDPKLLLEQVS